MKKLAIRLLLYLLIVRCEARRIPRGLEYDLFPNFRAVYHGHGATSYQNVDIQNHGSVPVPKHSQHIHVAEHLAHHEHEDHHVHHAVVLGTEEHGVEHYIIPSGAPYYDDQLSGHVTIEEVEIEPHHYQLYDQYDHRHYEYD